MLIVKPVSDALVIPVSLLSWLTPNPFLENTGVAIDVNAIGYVTDVEVDVPHWNIKPFANFKYPTLAFFS